MIVILEGCDKTGKTTLANKFQALGYEYRHFSAPAPGQNAYQELLRFLVDPKVLREISKGARFVLDRFHLGELVYPSIVGRESSMNVERFVAIEGRLDWLGAIVIHTTDEVPRIARRFKTDQEKTQKAHQIGDIVSGFKAAFRSSTLPGLTYRIDDAVQPLLKLVVSTHGVFQGVIMNRAIEELKGLENAN